MVTYGCYSILHEAYGWEENANWWFCFAGDSARFHSDDSYPGSLHRCDCRFQGFS